ncbi:MAG: HisA/HisF-related TIM barrel protein, partial [Planctomycetota bacterium]
VDGETDKEADRFEVLIAGGTKRAGLEVVEWSKRVADSGAGEILLTSKDTDGVKTGFDIPMTRAVADAVPVPVVASGGAGKLEHFSEGVTEGHAAAVLAASVFHFGELTVRQVKEHLKERGIPVNP